MPEVPKKPITTVSEAEKTAEIARRWAREGKIGAAPRDLKSRQRQPATVVSNIMHIRTTGDPRRPLTGNYRVSNSVIGVNVKVGKKGKIRPKLFSSVLKLRRL